MHDHKLPRPYRNMDWCQEDQLSDEPRPPATDGMVDSMNDEMNWTCRHLMLHLPNTETEVHLLHHEKRWRESGLH